MMQAKKYSELLVTFILYNICLSWTYLERHGHLRIYIADPNLLGIEVEL